MKFSVILRPLIATSAFLALSPASAAIRPAAAPAAVTISEFDDLLHAQGFAAPQCVAAGPEGALWVTEAVDQDFGTPAIVKIGSDGRRLAVYRYGEVTSPAGGDIVPGPDGALWFVDQSMPVAIVRMTTTGKFTKYRTDGHFPNALALGADNAFWFTEFGSRGMNGIGRLTTSGGLSTYAKGFSKGAAALDIAAGPGRAMWFTESPGDRIGRIGIDSHEITEFHAGITPGSGPYSIVAGPDGALWFTERYGRRIGRITTRGVVTESAPLPSGASPNDIAPGPDGALWFTEDHPSMIGRITTSGAITEYAGVSPGAGATCIVAGPDGDMWFTETGANRMGRVNLPAASGPRAAIR